MRFVVSGMGQLLVWEWQSESYVFKQQGHFNNMSSLAYSPDGQYIATGGDDGKVSPSYFKGLLSCKVHVFISSIHKHVSPVCQGTHKVSENKTLSLSLRTQISQNGGTTELIQICCRYDVISGMWAGLTPMAQSETLLYQKHVIWSLCTLASITNTQS